MGRLCYPTQAPGRVLVPRTSGARKLSRCKEGMAHFLQSGYRVLWPLRASRYRVVKIFVNYPGAVKFIGGSCAVGVCLAVLSCLGSGNKSKKCDKQLTHIVRVRFSYLFINESTSDFNFGRWRIVIPHIFSSDTES